jgi:hypothetical protein
MDHEWKIVGGPAPQPRLADSERYIYVVERGSVRTGVEVELSGTVMACDVETLPSPVDEAVRTKGAAIIAAHAMDDQLPARIMVDSAGVRLAR